MRDIVKIESEFMKNRISSFISGVLKNKKDIDIDIQLDEFLAENKDGRLSIHMDANAEMSEEDLKKILNKIHFLRKIIIGIINTRFIQNTIESALKKFLKKNSDIKINDLKCSMKESAAYVHFNANAEMPEENLKKILENAKLL